MPNVVLTRRNTTPSGFVARYGQSNECPDCRERVGRPAFPPAGRPWRKGHSRDRFGGDMRPYLPWSVLLVMVIILPVLGVLPHALPAHGAASAGDEHRSAFESIAQHFPAQAACDDDSPCADAGAHSVAATSWMARPNHDRTSSETFRQYSPSTLDAGPQSSVSPDPRPPQPGAS